MLQQPSTRKRIVVLISGSGSNLQAVIDACQAGTIAGEIVAVIANKPDAYGLVRAQNAHIDTQALSHKDFESRDAYDRALKSAIDTYQADLIVLAGFMRILTAEFVEHFRGKMLNIHPSLLPKYQGLNTHQRAIDAGDSEAGVSVHFVTEELDGGPVIAQAKVQIEANETAETLASKVLKREHWLYPAVIALFCSNRLNMVKHQAHFDGNLLNNTGISEHTLNEITEL